MRERARSWRSTSGHGYVLQDLSARMAPADWARKAIGAYDAYQADRIVAETNFGGAMVEATLRSVDAAVAFKAVTASRGKVVRAEPIAALYEQGKVHHVGAFPALEDQMCAFTFDPSALGHSPDRVDALVWGLTELMAGVALAGVVDNFTAMAANRGNITPEMLGRRTMPEPDAIQALGHLPPEPTEPETVTLHSKPFQAYQVRKNRYAAEGSGLVRVARDDVEDMIGAGCWPLANPEEKTDVDATSATR